MERSLNGSSYFNSAMQMIDLPVDLLSRPSTACSTREMALKLADVIFRRTDLGSAGQPDEQKVTFCAKVMGAELNWDQYIVDQELAEVNRAFQAGN
jgi:glycerol-3-phosphate dehydrogenase